MIGGFIDQTMGFEYEQDQMAKQGAELTPETWVMKLLLGPIDEYVSRPYDVRDSLLTEPALTMPRVSTVV